MTQAKAQTVVSALVGAGYRIDECAPDAQGSWFIVAHSNAGLVDSAALNTFASNQGVSASVDRAKFN